MNLEVISSKVHELLVNTVLLQFGETERKVVQERRVIIRVQEEKSCWKSTRLLREHGKITLAVCRATAWVVFHAELQLDCHCYVL